ncbi:MAG: glutathione S-transferase [Proteobacteria bacterium]|nr:glutathione S-transferase [Pseudomonadota bacterium]
MLALYFAPGASSMAVHIALHEAGAAFDARPISLARQEQRDAAFLALNPEGKVPLLLIDNRPLTEVAAILFYLARRFPDARLLPSTDVETEAQALSWMSFVASTLHPARRLGPEAVRAAFDQAETRLGTRDWALGVFSIADIHLFRLYWRLVNSRQPPPVAFPRLAAHAERMMARPAVRHTIAIERAIGYELPN